ncbi:hypothetical protein HXX76_009725 [Chlamydomonas incerta]|uniref:Protein kinase domain-containing protein n=1 Tax=Chlamydomonas incerta TaxID=51695 RepID=A0A835SQ04_CHLIN|nr:hypothetical protein HXX76_009725 [Chlamydomonas incerta]|eukprot:KAG2431197.1 hypothetical protein HXX76_009725 [Chlamydomonas incerta]
MGTAAGGPEEQQQWALWAWDEARVCRAAKLLPAGTGSSSGAGPPDLTWVTTDRPCSWRLAYVCVEEQVVLLAAGLSSSSAWYRRHFAPGAPAPLLPSPYAATGPVATSSDSSSPGSSSPAGLTLQRSGFVAGGPLGEMFWPGLQATVVPWQADESATPIVTKPFPMTMEVEDGAERFWQLGPVVTALYRGGNRRLTALRLVREGEGEDAWAAYQGQSPATGLPPPLGDGFVMGVRSPAFDAGPGYETYNVGPYNDYIVAVEGCFRANEVEGLTLVTRSGRRLQLGRGGCSHWFREDAPPGGYLAGAWSQFLNTSAWDRYINETYLRANYGRLGQLTNADVPWLHQLSFVWAAPAGSPPPSTAVHYAPMLDTLTQPPACPWASIMAGRFYQTSINACHPYLRVCSSNSCCNMNSNVPIMGPAGFPQCQTGLDACRMTCADASGLCGVVAEASAMHFLSVATYRQPQPARALLVAAPADAVADAVATAGPATASLGSYMINRVDLMSYADAVQFCARSSYMGVEWEMVHVQDAFDWAASGWTRRGAHEELSTLGYVWVAAASLLSDAAQPSAAVGSPCMRIAFGLPDGLDSPVLADSGHTLAVGDCALLAAVVCRAVARPLSASATAAATAAAALEASDAAVDAPATSSSSSSSGGLALVNVSSTYPPAAAVLGVASSLADRGLISPASAAAVWAPGPHTLTVNIRRLGNGPYMNRTADKDYCNIGIGPTAGNGSTFSSAAQINSSGGTAPSRGSVVMDLQQPVTAISVSVAVQLTNETDSVAVLSAVRLRLGTRGSWQHMGLLSSGGWETFQLAPGEVVVVVSGCTGGFVERVVFHTNAGRRWTHALLGAAAACSVPFLESAPQPGGYLVGMQGSVGYYIGSLQMVWGMPAGAASGAQVAGAAVAGTAMVTAAVALAVMLSHRRRRRKQELGAGKALASAHEESADGSAMGDGSGNGDGSGEGMPASRRPAPCTAAVTVKDGAAAIGGKPTTADRLSAVFWSSTIGGAHSSAPPSTSSVSIVLHSSALLSVAQSSCPQGSAGPSSSANNTDAAAGGQPAVSAAALLAYAAGPAASPRHAGAGQVAQLAPNYWAGAADAAVAAGAVTPTAAAAAAVAPVRATAAAAAVPALAPHRAAPAALAAMHPSDLESRLSAYIMRLDESLAWAPSRPAAGQATTAAAAGGSRARSGADCNGRPSPPAGGGAGHPEPGHTAARAETVAAVAEEDGDANSAVGHHDIGAAISGMQAALAGCRGAWQGLHVRTVLGRGAYGIVYLGTWRNLRVAIKTLVVHDALAGGQARQRHRAIIEAAISKSLQHPNVVTTYEAEVVPLAVVPEAASMALGDAGAAAAAKPKHPKASVGEVDVYKMLIIQEYCNVGSLAAALDDGVFGSIASHGPAMLCGLALALDIACGMRHIHRRNIIHGDLSAGNVLLSSRAGSEWQEPAVVAAEAAAELVPSGGILGPGGDETQGPTAAEAVTDAHEVAEGDAQLLRPLVGLWRPPVRAKVSDFGLSLPMGENQTHASNRFQLTALVRSCLGLSPATRPTFDQIAGQLSALLVSSHQGRPHQQQRQERTGAGQQEVCARASATPCIGLTPAPAAAEQAA